MELRQILRKSTGITHNADLPKGHLNGLLLILDIDESAVDLEEISQDIQRATLSAKFTHDKVEYLSTTLPLNFFNAYSDMKFGSTGSLGRLFQSNELGDDAQSVALGNPNEDQADAERVSVLFPYLNADYVIYIPFGSIWCDDGNEFEATLELASSNAIKGVNMYTVSNDYQDFHFIKYDIDFDLNEDHKSVWESYIFTETLNRDANVIVQAESRQYDGDLAGFRGAAQVFGEIENSTAGVLYPVFKSAYGVPEDVWIRVNQNSNNVPLQTAISRLGIVNIRLDFPLALSTGQAIATLQQKYNVVSKFQEMHADQAVAMISAGYMESAVEIFQEMQYLKAGKASPKTAWAGKPVAGLTGI